jgi:hypothetical protein
MQPIRPLPFVLEFQAGYSFMPQFEQIALRLHCSLDELAQELNLPIHLVRWQFDHLHHLKLEEAVSLARAFDVTENDVWNSTLEYFCDSLLTKTSQNRNSWEARVELQKVLNPFSKRLKICPLCIQEGRKIRLAWQTGWSFACLRHSTLLIDHCIGCDRPIASQRNSNSRLQTSNCCGNHIGQDQLCNQNFADLPRILLIDYDEILSAQQKLEALLAGTPQQLLQKPVASTVYLKAISELLELILGVSSPSQLLAVPTDCSESLQTFFDLRHNCFEHFRSTTDQTNPLPIESAFGSVTLMASGLPIAIGLGQLENQKAVSNALNKIIEKTCLIHPNYAIGIAEYLNRQLYQRGKNWWYYAISESIAWTQSTYRVWRA